MDALFRLCLGYGLACFLAVFVVGIFAGGFSNPRPEPVVRALLIAGGVGCAAMLWGFFTPAGAQVLIDPVRRCLCVHSRRRHEEIALAEMQCWQLREIPYPGGATADGQRVRYLLLEVLAHDGRAVPVHVFKSQNGITDETKAIAQKTQRCLAAWTDAKALKNIVALPPQEIPADKPDLKKPQAIDFAKAIREWRSGPNYSDLA